MKKLSLAAAMLIAVLLAIGWAVWSRVENRLEITNESGQAITFLTVMVGGETIRLEDIPADESVSVRFSIPGDGHFIVQGRLADGMPIAEDCGYVTQGMYGERAKFVIRPGGEVKFNQGQYQTVPSAGKPSPGPRTFRSTVALSAPNRWRTLLILTCYPPRADRTTVDRAGL